MPLRTPKAGRDLFLALSQVWRRKWVPLFGLCLCAGLGLAVLLLSVPQYRATSQVMIGGGLEASMATEQARLESQTVLGQVARRLDLDQNPYFTKARLRDRLSVYGDSEYAEQNRVFDRLQDGLKTRILPDTHIIEVSGLFPNPQTAARIVNATVDAYRQQRLDEKFEQSRQVGNWMGRRLEDIRREAEDASAKYQAFQAEHDATRKADHVAQLNTDITATQNQIAAINVRMKAVKKLADKDPTQAAAVIQELSSELATAQTTLADLEKQVADAAMDAAPSDDMTQTARDLQDQVASGQRIYEQFAVQYQNMLAQHEINLSDVRIVSFATVPTSPDLYCRLVMILMLAGGGFLLGLAYVLVNVIWARGFTTTEQLEAMTGYPVFASIPMAAGKPTNAVHHKVLQDPAAILAESLRSLRISLRLRGETGYRPRTVAFTSTLPDEGKTSLAVMLATIAAKSGERVCVVDCDLRRPSLHKVFGIGNARGLADYLSDRLGLEDVIHRRDPSGVHLITGKSIPSYSLTLLTSGRMERLVQALREQYDLVILDAPSSLAFADARVLGSMVDQTLYVVNWNRTPRRSVLASLKNYADLGYDPLALVMNKVSLDEYLRDSAAAVIYRYGHESGPGHKADTKGAFAA